MKKIVRKYKLGKSNVLLGEPLFDKGYLFNYRKFIAGVRIK
jgi:hypothetical protein